MEQWKVVPGTDGALEVSSEGRIKSNLRDGRILKATSDQKGYLRLRVTINRQKHSYKVHRLVAQAFVDNPQGRPQVNHKDGNKQNNRAENLEWVTNKDNAHHAMRNGLWKNVLAASLKENASRKKPIIATDIVTGESKEYSSISDAEREIGSRHITDVLKGKRRQAKGFTFVYKEGGDANDRTCNS